MSSQAPSSIPSNSFQNLLILYNPYYQENVIEQHLEILKSEQRVAFGKVKSKLSHLSACQDGIPQDFYSQISPSNPLQLFLTDYASLFVAKVIQVSYEDCSKFAPSYYKNKNFEVEMWFIISDLRELVRDDFATIRDQYLSNFKTPQHNNHTYALYGNSYSYPLLIEMKMQNFYFEEDKYFYPEIYKSAEYLQIQQEIIHYLSSKEIVFFMHPDSLENLIFAEMEFKAHKDDPFYDFSGVVIKYAKAVEKETHLFFRNFFAYLMKLDSGIGEISFLAFNKTRKVKDMHSFYPSLSSYNFLLNINRITQAVKKARIEFLIKDLSDYLVITREIRNKIAHEEFARLAEAMAMRTKIMGVDDIGIIFEFTKRRSKLKNFIK